MKYCKINTLEIDLNYANILNDFSIVQFSSTEDYIKYGALFLDEINLTLKTKSIVFEQGKSFFALFDKYDFEKIDLSLKLKSLKFSETLIYKIIDSENELNKIPRHLLSQLLINSISTPKHKRLSFNNLTGKLYLFNTNHFKISKTREKEQIFKIVGLEFKINKTLSLELNVRTFSNVLLSKKMDFSKKKFRDYAKYTFVYATNTLKRVLNSDEKTENHFILKQTQKNGKLEKNNIPFLDFKNLEDFKITKLGQLNDVMLSIKNKLSNYISLSFNKVNISNVIRFNNSFNIEKQSFKITLIDSINDEDSLEMINDLIKQINLVSPLSKLKISKKENKNGFNIKLIRYKAYYSRYNLIDPYKSNSNIQHITSQDFKINSKASIKAIIKELTIKNDIQNNQISIIDWKEYSFNEKWIFGNKIEDDFFFVTVYPNGKLEFEQFERHLFNQNEYDELCHIFDEDSNTEFIVKDNKGNINSIKKTANFSLPEFESIYEILSKESENLKINKEQVISYVEEIFELPKQNEFIQKINSLEKWNKHSLLNCFPSRTDKKNLTKIIKDKTSEVLKSYIRDKTRYEILDSQLDIHHYVKNERQFYFVGIKGSGIQQQISRASVIREIEKINESEFIFEELLPLMNVDFVKNGDLTVMPFPLKYLREWTRNTKPNKQNYKQSIKPID